MAKRPKADEEQALPGLTELLAGPKEPKPAEPRRSTIPEEDILGPLPQPGEAPRPEAVKVRVKAGAVPKGAADQAKPGAKKKGWLRQRWDAMVTFLDEHLIPQDPVARVRFKLRWLGLTRYLFVPLIVASISVALTLYTWWYVWDYSAWISVLSRTMSPIVLLVPLGIGLFAAFYMPIVLLVLNKVEARWALAMRDMLRRNVPTKRPRSARPSKAPLARTKPAAPKAPEPEPPLPQPTVNRLDA